MEELILKTIQSDLEFSAISIKITMIFFTEIEKSILKWIGNQKDFEWPMESWEIRSELEASHVLISKYKAWFYEQLIFNKEAKITQWGKECLFNNVGKIDTHMQKIKLGWQYK